MTNCVESSQGVHLSFSGAKFSQEEEIRPASTRTGDMKPVSATCFSFSHLMVAATCSLMLTAVKAGAGLASRVSLVPRIRLALMGVLWFCLQTICNWNGKLSATLQVQQWLAG